MGPQLEAMIIYLSGGFVWAAALGIAFAVLVLLVRRRSRVPGEIDAPIQTVEDTSSLPIETHAAALASDEITVPGIAVEETGRSEPLPPEPRPEEVPTGMPESTAISEKETPEEPTAAVNPPENVGASNYGAPVLPPNGETITQVPTETKEQNVEDIPVRPPECVSAETVGEIAQIAGTDEQVIAEAQADAQTSAMTDETSVMASPGPGKERQETQESDTAEPTKALREIQGEETAEEEDASESENEGDEERGPSRYSAPTLVPGKVRKAKGPKVSGTAERTREDALELRVRAVCDRHGFCRFGIVARRTAGGPPQMEARAARRTVLLSEVGDDWFEVADLNDMAGAMDRGLRVVGALGEGSEVRWELRGRDLYVLAELHGLFGFVSTTRLSIGGKQIVVCRADRAPEVAAILSLAGCQNVHARGRDFGAPPDWVFFGPVIPSHPLPQVPGEDVLNVIRPIPDVEIRLEGGLWLRGNSWIVGYPPKVHIVGEIPPDTAIMIDGIVAQEREEHIYDAENSERPGSHTVWCAGKSSVYEICEPDTPLESWTDDGLSRRVCGAAVAESGSQETLTRVPTSNPVLIGANPGDVFRCDKRPGKEWVGLVPFPAVWALPEDALHCDRKVRRVVLMKPTLPTSSVVQRYRRTGAHDRVLEWCHAIRDCGRKRLPLSTADAGSEELWRIYLRKARAIWRVAR